MRHHLPRSSTSMFLLQDGRSLDKERRLSTSHVRRTTPNRITRALSIPIEGSRAQKQAITVAGAVAVAAVTAAVVTWAVSGISAFFARRRPPGTPKIYIYIYKYDTYIRPRTSATRPPASSRRQRASPTTARGCSRLDRRTALDSSGRGAVGLHAGTRAVHRRGCG